MRIDYTEPADDDIRHIWQHHAESVSAELADEIVDRIKTAVERVIAAHPSSGRKRPEFGEDVRSFPILPHIVFYRITGRRVEVMRVLHGHRDIRKPLMSLLLAV